MGKKLRIVTQEGCDHCAKLEKWIEDDEVRDVLKKEGVDKVELVDSRSAEADDLFDAASEKTGNDMIGDLFKPTPITIIEDDRGGTDGIVMGYSNSYGRKVAKEIGAEENIIDKLDEMKDKVLSVKDMITGK